MGRYRLVIYGAGSAGKELLTSLQENQKIEVFCFIDDHISNNVVDGTPVYNPEIININFIEKNNIQELIIAIPSLTPFEKYNITNRLKNLPIKVRTLPDIKSLFVPVVKYADLRELDVEEILSRSESKDLISNHYITEGCEILITGAGGSIGSELCRQIVLSGPQKILLLDSSEFALYSIEKELSNFIQKNNLNIDLVSYLGSVCDEYKIKEILSKNHVDIIYHAAAYKHVPLVEKNPIEGLRNNSLGTWLLAKEALRFNVKAFVLISTDKAVRPANIMGLSKKLAEVIIQSISTLEDNDLHDFGINHRPITKFSIVRFGNVLGSSGSVIPLFKEQIMSGGPVTITHPEVTRYFMSIPEAASLVINSVSLVFDMPDLHSTPIFILNMGEPYKILDLAEKMISFYGLSVRGDHNPLGDIEIRTIGLRPGEKLHEQLTNSPNLDLTKNPKIMMTFEEDYSFKSVKAPFQNIISCLKNSENFEILLEEIRSLIPGEWICNI